MNKFLLALLLGWVLHPMAQAECTWSDGLIGPTIYRVQTPSTYTMNVTYANVGQRVWDVGGADGAPSWKTSCSGGEQAGYINSLGSPSPVLTGEKGPIYEIAQVPGLGYSLSETQAYDPPNFHRQYGTLNAPSGQYYFDAGRKLRVDFWKTGNLQAGRYCLAAGTRMGSVRFGSLDVIDVILASGLCLDVVAPTCTVQTDSKQITVPLGNRPVTSFSGVGSVGPTVPFSIRLGACSNVSQVTIQFNAVADADYPSAAAAGVLSTAGSPSPAATGVGIQLMDGRTSSPMILLQPKVMWNGTSGTTSISLPFGARYIQTRSTVTPGYAHGSAQFVLSYQ